MLRLPLDEALFAKYKHLVVEVDDVDDENLLEHFAATNAFIQEGLDGGGGVLVHWSVRDGRFLYLRIQVLLVILLPVCCRSHHISLLHQPISVHHA